MENNSIPIPAIHSYRSAFSFCVVLSVLLHKMIPYYKYNSWFSLITSKV